MKKAKFLTLVALILVAVFCFAACTVPDITNPTEAPTDATQPVDPTNPEDPTNPSEGPTDPAVSTPVISVVPENVEINAGDEIDLMFGVTVTDEGDEEVRLIIEDDSDFDAESEGVYVITYKAINKFGKEATATRTITVNKALSAVSVEVKANRLGENKWTGNIISFKNQLFVELSANTTLEALSGVFHNTSSSAIVLNIGGGYGVAAIIDANGVVIEGRDGANGRVVNAANPVRSSSTVNTIEINGENVSVVENFAKNLVVPAGGYAIVVQNGYAGTTVDSDGRGFMNYNVIYQIGNVVRVFWADTNEDLTTYVDQAPEVSGNNNIVAAMGDDGFNLESAVLAGVIAKDDNGTFVPTDDTNATVTITDNGGFNIGVVGKYTITLTATDGKLTTTFTRVVEVVDNSIKLILGGKNLTVAATKWIYNQEVTTNTAARYSVIAYDKKYTGTFTTNGYGAALVLDQYGRLVKIYDGANLGFWTAEGKTTAHFTVNNYATVAWDELQDGELLLICPNDGGSNTSRGWALGHRPLTAGSGAMGQVASITGFTFPEAPHDCTSKCAKCGGCLDAECTEAVCATKCPGHAHECESKCTTCGKCLDMACTEAVCAEKCTCHECESKCDFCGKCTDAACEFPVCAEKCSGHVGSMLLTIGAKKFEAVDGKWAINQTITTSTAASKAVWVFTKDYTGEFTTNGYGVAVVLDRYGRVAEVYDGANGGYWLPDGKQASAHFTTATYATVAWSELQEGETLVVLPNGGSDGNAARQIGLDCRYLFNQKLSITGVTFADPNMTITIGAKTYTATEGKWAVNETITTSTAANKAIWIFTKEYTGEFTTNSYGVAVVLDSEGKVARVYDGANGGYWLPDGKQASAHFTTATYATVAWSELQEGETLVVLPNGGSDGNAARQIGLDCRYLFNQKMSITGITFGK